MTAVPLAVVPEGDDAFVTFDDNNLALEVLTEREGVPYDEYGDIDLGDATTISDFRTQPTTGRYIAPNEEEVGAADVASWLEEDDIEDE